MVVSQPLAPPPALPASPGSPDFGIVTDRGPGHVARDMQRRLADLERTNGELEAFNYSISHDLQAPLRQIAGFTDLLAREAGGALNETARQYLDDIAGAATQMSTLVEALLALSRTERGLETTTVDLEALVRETAREQSRLAPDRTIDWIIGRMPRVRGDRRLLHQVFVNLLGNAVKYTRPRPRARIEIGTTALSRRSEVGVFVTDNGVGFDMRDAGRLFSAFERLHPASAFEGTGVGLALVQRIVTRHGGRVWATGTVGAGATFVVALPRARRRAAFPPCAGAWS